jgi:hypothetical protein
MLAPWVKRGWVGEVLTSWVDNDCNWMREGNSHEDGWMSGVDGREGKKMGWLYRELNTNNTHHITDG